MQPSLQQDGNDRYLPPILRGRVEPVWALAHLYLSLRPKPMRNVDLEEELLLLCSVRAATHQERHNSSCSWYATPPSSTLTNASCYKPNNISSRTICHSHNTHPSFLESKHTKKYLHSGSIQLHLLASAKH